ncbi:MAG: hypothetical protein ACD_23C00086G0003 [uncultured bacterium]|nr:MAG: hypothetical protein ACD_23C00086G0003 [uncultured bacterium]
MIVEANPDIGVHRTLRDDLAQGVLLCKGERARIMRSGAAPHFSDGGKNFIRQLHFKGLRVFFVGVDDQAVEVAFVDVR